jgi:hypothetical protein
MDGPAPEKNEKRKQWTTMMLASGVLLAVCTLMTLWTAFVLYSGLATSLAWGERGDQNPLIWFRKDVPLLLWIAIAQAVAAAILLIAGGRRARRPPRRGQQRRSRR